MLAQQLHVCELRIPYQLKTQLELRLVGTFGKRDKDLLARAQPCRPRTGQPGHEGGPRGPSCTCNEDGVTVHILPCTQLS